jgi:tRNA 2-selenouridine synthase
MSGVAAIEDAEPATLAGFDVIVDVRSPAEFAIDHVPGALSMPVLSDAERAEVGTIYVQESRFKARRVGGAYVARNVARHLETAMAEWPAPHRPLIYCWRGGMRSNSMAIILAEVGWRTSVLKGGYRTYRRRVSTRLYDGPPAANVVLLEGCTGSGKTEVLARLGQMGVQIVDLEQLAAHRGSLFGAIPGRPQPSQKMFESELLAALDGLDPARPVVVEAESSKIGEIIIPPALWAAMERAPRIELVASPEARARYLADTYAELARDANLLAAGLERLPDRLGRRRREAWMALAREGAFVELAGELIDAHYDPAYRRSSRKEGGPRIGKVAVERLDRAGFNAAAAQVAAVLQPASIFYSRLSNSRGEDVDLDAVIREGRQINPGSDL